MSNPETVIMHEILVAVTALPETFAIRQNVGTAVTARGAVMKFGVEGQADIGGVHRGRGFQIEVKTKTGRLRDAQRRFRDAWEKAGGLYIVARSVDDALRGLSA